jgi:hypothetical protein
MRPYTKLTMQARTATTAATGHQPSAKHIAKRTTSKTMEALAFLKSTACWACFVTLAIIALSGCTHHGYRQSFQSVTVPANVTLPPNVTITASEPAAAISDTDCATDFADVFPADSIFDDRLLADWGDKDDGCDPWPQNDREF